MAALPELLTYREWLGLPCVHDATEEVVNGRIRLMPPNKTPHADVVLNLTLILARQLDRERVRMFSSTFGLVIRKNPVTCRVPDLAVFLRYNMVEEDGYIHSAPQLLIEVLSPDETRREQAEKMRDYESIGVPEVWLVSPEACSVEVFLPQDGRLKSTRILVEGELRPVHFPEACVEVASIWHV